MFGLRLDTWNSLTLLFLGFAAFAAVALVVSQWAVIRLQKEDARAAAEALEKYKAGVATEVAALNSETARANERAAEANRIGAAANERAATLERDAEVARLEQERLRKQLAWRRLTEDQMKILVVGLAGTTDRVTLEHLATDPEATQFAADIEAAFRGANIQFERKPAIVFSDGPIVGIRLYGRPDSISRFGQPFVDAGIVVDGVRKDIDFIEVFVASKPLAQ